MPAHPAPTPPPVPAGATRLTAVCSTAVAATLLDHDHHRVNIDGREGVLITYPLLDLPPCDSSPVWVIVHESARQHPPASDAVQRIVDRLSFCTGDEPSPVRPDQT